MNGTIALGGRGDEVAVRAGRSPIKSDLTKGREYNAGRTLDVTLDGQPLSYKPRLGYKQTNDIPQLFLIAAQSETITPARFFLGVNRVKQV